MSTYIFVNVNIHEPVEYEDYKKLTPDSIVAYGGKFIVRGGETEILEGNPTVGRIVVIKFPDVKTAKAWWNSTEYSYAKSIRQRTATTEMILVEGVI